ncbi:MAG: c-type cytochrome [Gemmatimonadaceae bacterium]
MASVGRWLARILMGLIGIVAVAGIAIYAMSERYLTRTYPVRTVAITRPTDSVSLARGAHLARISCFGCHGDSLQGKVFFDVPMVGRIVAPNALERLTGYSDPQLAGLIRYGVRPDGTSPVIMPPKGMYHMSDADLAAIIAYLRTLPTVPTPKDLPRSSYGPVGRLGLITGQFGTATNAIDTTVARIGADTASAGSRAGEYLANMICTSCHGTNLTGDPATPSPSIVNAAGYTLPELTTLFRTSTPRNSATKLTLMAVIARTDLKYLTDDEIAAIHGYLTTLPASGVPHK